VGTWTGGLAAKTELVWSISSGDKEGQHGTRTKREASPSQSRPGARVSVPQKLQGVCVLASTAPGTGDLFQVESRSTSNNGTADNRTRPLIANGVGDNS